MGEFAKLDPLLHSELRLAVMSTLLTMEEADFVYLREATGATAGNLSVQIDKLFEAGYTDGVPDNGCGEEGVCGVCGGTKVVSALSADTTSLRVPPESDCLRPAQSVGSCPGTTP